ncbi:hypothetical protein PSTG_02894 [Puccinia striiformis f. sp. tritici PST-78]|uniref:Uncharacterized protein n=1 Tax=Puccinia striiformis f. sp. tritici PST-78 TaxID=1165861 RepID=A0A0L0VWV2_9BASI|nr:hypothetical protein PSTG_02894 [Puccinia striiformis f. sp. tritici PST-78]
MHRGTSDQTRQNRIPRKGLQRSQSYLSISGNQSELKVDSSSGPIRSRAVGTDSDTGSDGLREFAARSSMAKDIESERLFREANKGKAKPKVYQPTRRPIEDDDENEQLDVEAVKALKWRPKNGRPPEHMSASVAAQQKKYNPLIKLLGIKIKIIRSNDDEDSSSTDQDNIIPPASSATSRNQDDGSGIELGKIAERQTLASPASDQPFQEDLTRCNETSFNPTQEELVGVQECPSTASEDEPPKKAPAANTDSRALTDVNKNNQGTSDSEQLELRHADECPSTASEEEPSKKPVILNSEGRHSTNSNTNNQTMGVSTEQKSDCADECPSTASEDEPPKPPFTAISERHNLINNNKNNQEACDHTQQESGYAEECATTASEDEPTKKPSTINRQRKTLTDTNMDNQGACDHIQREMGCADECPTTASEDEPTKIPSMINRERKTLKDTNKDNQGTCDHTQQEIGCADECPTTASEEEPAKCADVVSTTASENEATDIQTKARSEGDSEMKVASTLPATVPDQNPRKQQTSSERTTAHSNPSSDLYSNSKRNVLYPRIQLEARPNLEISSEIQDAIGPLPLSKTVELTASINKFLKPYQRDGVKFFFKHFQQKNGVILGDDMGLGKTIQVIAFLSAVMGLQGTPDEKHRRKTAINKLPSSRAYKPSDLGPTCLVICPNSVIDNWSREIQTWGYFEHATLGGNNSGAETIARFNAGAFDILVCGSSYARDHIDDLHDMDFTVVVVDEVHHLKNPRSAMTRAFYKFKTKIRFGLTGTAMQNDLSELHSLFDWVRPGALGTVAMWEAFVSNPIKEARKSNASVYELQLGADRAQALVDKCWPDLQLRRTKAKILHELPPRTDQIALCPMTEVQKLAHKNLLSDPDVVNMRNHDMPCPCNKVNKDGQHYKLGLCCDQGWSGRIFPYLILLQKLANHLALTYPNKQDKPEKYEQDKLYLEKMFPDDKFSREQHFSSKYDTELCGKWKVLKPLLEQWKKDKFKVLLFSQSTKMMDILEYWLQQDFPEFVRLDGSVAIRERFKRVEEFQTDPNKFIFLASIKAAGVGLNLTAANKVVIFDPSWNPSHDAQAMDRVVRIGQKREVECIRLISSGTTEELIYHRQVYKQGLSEVANTGQAPSRHFTGVQGNKKNQGDIFGVKNIFKQQASERASLDPDENLDDFSYAVDQFITHGAIVANSEAKSKDQFELVPLQALPQVSQPDAMSAEALLRNFGADRILPHGEVVKDALDPTSHRDRMPSQSKRTAGHVGKKPRHGMRTISAQPPLRGVKLKSKIERKKIKSGKNFASDNDTDSSSSSDSCHVQGIISKDFGLTPSKRKKCS